jgi:hypothetical protein
MEPFDAYTSTLIALIVALLFVASGFAKKQLVWRRRSVPVAIRCWRRR